MARAAALGARAVLVANNGSTGFFRMTQTDYTGTVSIPAASLPQNTARYLVNALAAGSALTVSFSRYVLPSGALPAILPSSSPAYNSHQAPHACILRTRMKACSSCLCGLPALLPAAVLVLRPLRRLLGQHRQLQHH